jgi:hypothetical protein
VVVAFSNEKFLVKSYNSSVEVILLISLLLASICDLNLSNLIKSSVVLYKSSKNNSCNWLSLPWKGESGFGS